MAFGDTIVAAVLGKVSVPEDTDNSPNVIAEGAAVNTTVGITAHSTFANGNASLDYSLSADSSGGGFKIDHNTGVVTVADPSKIDFESAPGHVYTITVLATKNNNFSNEQTFTISVNDVAPSAPVDSNAAANTVLEGAANGTTVGITASSTDVNGGAVTYSLTGDTSGGGFTINATTGVVTVADGSKIDFESAPGHAYTVTVQSSDGTLTSSQAFTINVGDVAMTTPVDTNGAANTVAEGAAAGTTVGITASATDPSGPATTYSLIGDTSGGGFTINASTGVVTVANPAKLDFESSAPGHTYNITVQASNGVQTTSQVFTVGVTDVAPSAPTDSNGAANTVVEGAANGTAVGVTASSADVNGGAVTYSLIGDTSGGGFTINATTGVVTVADSTKINFETAPGHAYTVTAQSSDGTLTNSQTFTIAVTDVAPTAPVDSNGATNTVAEGAANGSTVGVTAFSTDVNGPGVTYSLVGDTSGGGFTINSTTGVITVADGTKLDYETTPSHAYTVTAQASDGTLTNSQAFTIALTDVAPSAPTDINGAANTVAEGAANGSTVGITASSVDPNGPATTYTLSDSAGGRFAIDSSTGIVTVANGAAIDFETAPGHAYGITVLATNGALATSSAFSIGVTDVAPSTPTDTNGAADSVFEGAANGTVVGITASSTDPGGGPAPTYTLTDNAGGRFAIDSTTGIVTVANGAAIDFETAPGPGHSYGITVQSTAGALSSTHTFSIGVGDVNEAPAGTDKTVTMLEGDSYTFTVADFGFSDPSDSVNPNSLQAVKMTTVPGAGTGTFTNNGITVNANDFVSATDIAAGHLVFTPTAHSNGAPEASFTFQVQDNGGTANGGVDLDQSPNTVTINVNAVNDAPINSVPGTQSVNEDATLTFSSGTGNAITISDVDVGSGNETVTLTVTNGTLALGSHAGLVSFSPDNAASITLTGTIANIDNALNGLTYTGNLNFNGTETLTVSTNDNGNTGAGGPKIDSDPITINVAAVNDAPVNAVPGAQTVNEDTPLVFTGANAISISDVDANGLNETVTLSVASGALTLSGTAGLVFGTGDGTADSTMTFTGTVSDINAALNGLSYQGNLNFNGSDTLNITTNDNGNTGSGGAHTAISSVAINVTAVNDAPSFTVGGTQNVLEDSGAHTVNGFIAAFSPGPSDEAGQAVNFLTSNDNSALFSAAPTIDVSGNLTYTLAANANGSATVTVQIHDNGGTANGGVDTSVAQTFVINAGPVNDAPAGTDNTLTTLEDTSHTFTAAEFGFSDPVDAANASGANNFQSVIITTIPGGAAGTLTDNGVTLVAGATVSKADIDGGLLKFNPAANANGNGEAAFTFQVKDDGGTANLGVDTDQSPNTMTFNVTSVNDAPAGTDTTIASVGAHTFAASEFGFTDPVDAASAAGANNFAAVTITTLPGSGTLTDNGVAVTTGQSISISDINSGLLVFTPTGNATGTFTFQVQDDGGLANGGVDTDQSPNSFTIQQNAPPVIDSNGGGATAAVSAAENQTAVTTVHATDPDNSPVTPVSYSIVSGDDQLKFAINSTSGVLTFITAPDFENPTDTSTAGNNTYIVTVQATDGASVDQQTITVTVTDVNDAPVITSNAGGATASINVNENTTAVTTVTATDQDSPAQTLTYSLVAGGDSAKFSIDPSSGVLTFNTAPNFEVPTDTGGDNGYDVTVRVTDSGAPNLHDDQAITVHVQDVNEAPDTASVTVTGAEDPTGPAYIPITLTGTDPDTVAGDHVASFHITNVPNTGTQGTLYSDIGLTTQVTNGADVTATGNAATLYFVPNANFNTHAGAVTFNAAATDTHSLTDATPGTETINVTAVNDAPVNNGVPSSFTVQSGFNHIVTGLSISDVDANEVGTPTDITTTFTAGAGTVKIGDGSSGGTAGIASGATITTNGTGTVVLTGSIAQINTTLSGNNVAYNAADSAGNGSSTTTLQMATNDHGHNGGGALTDTDTINVGVIPQVWFINSNQTGLDSTAVRGSQTNPFSTITEFNASSGPGTNDYVYLKAGTYSGDGINLKAGQTLLGDDQALSFTNPLGGPAIVIEDGTHARPTINVTTASDQGIALASGNTVAGIIVTTGASTTTGIDDSGASVGTLNISDTDVTGNGQAINITHGGTGGSMTFGTVSSTGGTTGIALGGALATNFSATTGTLSGHSTSEVAISGGSGTVSYAGAIGDGSGLSASVSGRTAGTVTLSGNITDGADAGGGITVSGNTGGTIDFTGATKTLNTTTGNAVALSSNTGATVDFTGGGLGITTTSGTGFSANTGTVTVTGLGNTIGTTSGTALNLSNLTVGANGVTFDSATTTSAATGISINTVTGGAINVNGGSIAGATSNGVNINAAQDNISIASSVASTAAGHSVQVTNSGKVGGNTITFSGGVTDPGLGINLDNNDQNTGGATVNFTGALNIDSTTHTGFNATNGGTVSANNAANSITTTTGTALNVANTTIGGSNLIFNDISANGAVNGIVLNNTGTSGHLAVTGTTTNGGTIQSTTGDAVSLTSTQDVSLSKMTISNNQGDGINGSTVNGIVLSHDTISGNGNSSAGFGEGNIYLAELTGNASHVTTFDNLTVSNAYVHNVFINNSGGTLTDLVVTNSSFTNNGASTQAGDAFQINLASAGLAGSPTATVHATHDTFSGHINFADPTTFTATGFAGNADDGTLNVHLGDGTAGGLNTLDSNDSGITLSASNTGNLNFDVNDNTINHNRAVGIAVNNFGTGTVNGFLRNLVVGQQNVQDSGAAIGAGIDIDDEGNGNTTLSVTNNIVQSVGDQSGNQLGFQGINVLKQSGSQTTSGTFNLTLTGNTIRDIWNDRGLLIEDLNTGGNSHMNLNVTGNTFSNANAQGGNTTARIGGAPGGSDHVNVTQASAAVLASDNGLTASGAPGNTMRVDTNVFFSQPGPSLPTPTPQLALHGQGPGSSQVLDMSDLTPIFAMAIQHWADAGASAAQIAALEQATSHVTITDMTTPGVLAETDASGITIDANAAGWGWFIDHTPADNSEFTATGSPNELVATSGDAAGHIDLLTVVEHELGHIIGLGDSDSPGVMNVDLDVGERRLPDATDVAMANAPDAVQAEAALPASARAAIGTAIVAATAGNDTIDAGHGGNILFGGAGADNFVFGPATPLNAPTPAQVTHVADYHAAEGDTFDFSAITSAFHNSSVNDSLVVRAVEDASGKFATLQVDHIDPMGLPSAPNWVNVAQIDGAHAGDAVNVLIDNHSVHLAQIHVDLLV